MTNAILLHGCCDKEEFFDDSYPSLSNSHWFPWLQKQLTINAISTQKPEMPEPHKPSYKKWKKEFGRLGVNHKTILVGHSCGAEFLLRWLSENKQQVAKLILVAPWIDPIKKRKGFSDFQIDPNLKKRIKEVHLFYSDDDSTEGVPQSVEIIKPFFSKMQLHRFTNKGHFTLDNMHTEKFPEILELIL